YNNTAKATVAGGAHLDAAEEIGVESEVKYPFLIENPLSSINPLDYLKTTGPEGLALFEDGTLGYASNPFNTFALTAASAGSVSVGGSFVLNKYVNDSEATIGAGAQVNQDTDPRFHEGVQTVTVAANTEMNLIHVAGVGSLGFNIEGIADAKEAVSET